MATATEMQHLHPGRLSDQSARTVIDPEQSETKSEQLLQAILDELRTKTEPQPTSGLARTSTKDFSTGVSGSAQSNSSQVNLPQHSLPRGISSTGLGSSRSLSGTSEERFYQQLFTAVVAFSAFGGSITFQCIFPNHAGDDGE